MPVPASINDLSTTPASNSPQGSEPALPLMDDYIRTHASFIAFLRDNKLNSSAVSAFILTLLDDADAAAARATLGAAGLAARILRDADLTPAGFAAQPGGVVTGQMAAAMRGVDGAADDAVSAVNNSNSGALLMGAGYDWLKSAVSKIPAGQSLIIDPLRNIEVSLLQSQAQNLAPALATTAPRAPMDPSFIGPGLAAAGLLAAPGVNRP